MWQDYCSLNLQVQKIYHQLNSEGEQIINDHIALRTFQESSVGLDVLSAPFIKWGYVAKGEYFFKEKKLYAKHYEHTDPKKPKIFISELELGKFSENLQQKVTSLLAQVPSEYWKKTNLSCVGRPWKISYDEYLGLLKESEYAAWVAAFGFRPNHFTVNINALAKFERLEQLNAFLKKQGYALNDSGGEIKGSPQELLEQSSTLAERVEVIFDGEGHDEGQTKSIPACYYEFAKRYPDKSGKMYQGFIAKSADKIFESTDTK